MQVNGAFDLPHVRLSGISTPYVRVHLLSGQRHKDTRSNFLNLGTNRKCMFDQMTLEEAHRYIFQLNRLGSAPQFERTISPLLTKLSQIDLPMNFTVISQFVERKAKPFDFKMFFLMFTGDIFSCL